MFLRPTFVVFASALLLLAGCKDKEKKSADDDGPPETTVEDAKKAVSDKLAAVNKLVPPEMKDTLKFTVKSQKGDHSVGIVPEGWAPGMMPGSVEPSDKTAGSVTSFRIDHNCDGMCEPKDWAKVVEKVDYDGLKTGGVVQTDKSTDGQRFLRIKGEWGGKPRVIILVARWHAKAKRYFKCTADLEGAYTDAADAFEATCKAFVVTDWRG